MNIYDELRSGASAEDLVARFTAQLNEAEARIKQEEAEEEAPTEEAEAPAEEAEEEVLTYSEEECNDFADLETTEE